MSGAFHGKKAVMATQANQLHLKKKHPVENQSPTDWFLQK
jgi:hypothetical protein